MFHMSGKHDVISDFLTNACEASILDRFRNRRVHTTGAQWAKDIPTAKNGAQLMQMMADASASGRDMSYGRGSFQCKIGPIPFTLFSDEHLPENTDKIIDNIVSSTGKIQKELAELIFKKGSWLSDEEPDRIKSVRDVEKMLRIEEVSIWTMKKDGRLVVELYFETGELFADHVCIVDNKFDQNGRYTNTPIDYILAG